MGINKLIKLIKKRENELKGAKFSVVQSFEGFSIFQIENKQNLDLSGKVTCERIEYYGCGFDKFFESNERGVQGFIDSVNADLETKENLIN